MTHADREARGEARGLLPSPALQTSHHAIRQNNLTQEAKKFAAADVLPDSKTKLRKFATRARGDGRRCRWTGSGGDDGVPIHDVKDHRRPSQGLPPDMIVASPEVEAVPNI
jgi:hypothetical protein